MSSETTPLLRGKVGLVYIASSHLTVARALKPFAGLQ